MARREAIWIETLSRFLAVVGLATAVIMSASAAQAFRSLYSFEGGTAEPAAALLIDASHNYYGTTTNGSTAFRLTPGGVYTTVHTFTGAEGGQPLGDMILGPDGFFYGTNYLGGGPCGCGTVFKMSPAGAVTVLYTFLGGNRGGYPAGKLAMDSAGNLYGTTSSGGASNVGTVFKLTPGGTQTLLRVFNGSNGAYPERSSLVFDGAGNLYGTTSQGGTHGGGTVFKIAPDGTSTILHNFQCCFGDGAGPNAGVILDGAGNLYGTLSSGGANGAGSIFKLTPARKLTRLYSFGGAAGRDPTRGLIMDAAGNLYGTTPAGGSSDCDCGVAYKVTPAGEETVLHTFLRGKDGADPQAPLTMDKAGRLYGTTFYGGDHDGGAIFSIP